MAPVRAAGESAHAGTPYLRYRRAALLARRARGEADGGAGASSRPLLATSGYHGRVSRGMLLNGLLLLLIAGAIGAVQLVDRGSSAVEGTVRRYAAAVTAQDLDGATAELAPASRPEWAPWVEGQLGNSYEVKGIGVRSPSLLDRLLRHAPAGPVEVTVVLDVNRGDPEQYYQPTTRVPVTRVEGRWYLVEPLLAPEAQG